MTEILIQILLVVLIIASIVLIAALWRFYEVLSDTKETTSIVAKRMKQADNAIDKAKASLSDMTQVVKGFVYSFDFLRTLREKIKSNAKTKEQDEEK